MDTLDSQQEPRLFEIGDTSLFPPQGTGVDLDVLSSTTPKSKKLKKKKKQTGESEDADLS